jgi:hypothetical protein
MRTLVDAAKQRCPYGVSECCVTTGCMAWGVSDRGVETDWVRVDPKAMTPDEVRPEGPHWRLTMRPDPQWVNFEPGGDCRRLK